MGIPLIFHDEFSFNNRFFWKTHHQKTRTDRQTDGRTDNTHTRNPTPERIMREKVDCGVVHLFMSFYSFSHTLVT